MNFKIFSLINIVLTFFVLSSFSQTYEKTKSIKETFAVSQQATVHISNKYGDIKVLTWDKDSVYVAVEIIATDKKETNAQETLDDIEIVFSHSSIYLSATTTFNNVRSQFKAGFNAITNSIFNPLNKVKIYYTIYLPSSCDLIIDNKYGNVYSGNFKGSFDLTLSNGNYQGNSLENDCKINVSFGNAFINSINKGNISLLYADMELSKAAKLNVESRNSRLRIVKAEHLIFNSTKDKIIIDTSQNISGKSYFTYFNILNVKESFILKSSYGEVYIESIDNDFKNIDINSSYTNIRMSHSVKTDFIFDINTKNTTTNIDENYSDIIKTNIEGTTNEFSIKGNSGDRNIKNAIIKCNLNGGSLNMKIR